MRTLMTASMIVAFGAALALATGCEDSPLTAGKDFKIFVAASKTAVYPNPAGGGDQTTIVATIVDDTGVPQKGFVVLFGTDGGDFATSGGVSTDSNGNASNVLTVTLSTPALITVTATSSSLSGTVKITNGDFCTTGSTNVAPVADFNAATPPNGDGTVDMTSTSTDSDGLIVTTVWNCGGGVLTPPGTGLTAECIYPVTTPAKTYTISITVTDNGDGGSAPPYYCQKSATKTRTVTISP
jgi:hypothetical protein